MNLTLFRAINGGPRFLEPTMTFFSGAMNIGWVKIVLGLLLLGLLFANPLTRRTAVQALIAFPIANEFTELFKNLLPRNRPYQDLNDVIVLMGRANSHGTASAHAANMVAVAFVFVYYLRWWGSPWVIVALITSYSRVYVGAHYPYQVFLGWCCGLLAGFGVTYGWKYILSKRKTVIVSEPVDESQQ